MLDHIVPRCSKKVKFVKIEKEMKTLIFLKHHCAPVKVLFQHGWELTFVEFVEAEAVVLVSPLPMAFVDRIQLHFPPIHPHPCSWMQPIHREAIAPLRFRIEVPLDNPKEFIIFFY